MNKAEWYDNTNQQNYDEKFIVGILAIGFATGTVTHFMDMVHLGFLVYSKLAGVSTFQNIFWTFLLFADPFVLVLLLTKRKLGAIIGFIIILADVLVNTECSVSIIINNSESITLWLQIALLTFSGITLPELLINKRNANRIGSMYIKMFSMVPLIALIIGLIIHIVGLINLFSVFNSYWNAWVHISMTFIDSFIIYALFRRLLLGYWLGITGFGIFGLLQTGLALGKYFKMDILFSYQNSIALSISFIAIAALLSDKDKFVNV